MTNDVIDSKHATIVIGILSLFPSKMMSLLICLEGEREREIGERVLTFKMPLMHQFSHLHIEK